MKKALLRLIYRYVLAMAVCVAAAHAQTTIHVPADQPTIQAGINAAQPGDTVLVAPGTYFENINFLGKAITVQSTDGPAVTTIDGSAGSDSVVKFVTSEGNGSLLKGFTITRGNSVFNAGGITINRASPIIDGNVITGNQTCDSGAGIQVLFSSAVIRNNTVSSNFRSACSGGVGGGGIEVGGAGNAQILNNEISNNRMPNSAPGGGISANAAGTPLISGNKIFGNVADGEGGGIAMFNHTDATIVNNLIYGNTANGVGGGVYFLVPSGARGPFLINNTIANNSGTDGSEVFADGFDSAAQLINNIAFSLQGSPIQCGNGFGNTNGILPIFSFNDAFSPAFPGFGGFCSSLNGTNSNISADPLFVNATANNYHLQSTSPAIDAGTNAAPNLSSQDLDGNPRIASPPGAAAIIDMGAYEFVPPPQPAISVSPSSLAFGNQTLNTASPTQTIIVTNPGTATLHVNGLSISGDPDFFTTNNNCVAGSGVLPGGNCSIQVEFVPRSAGAGAATLAISSDATKSPVSVSFSGTGGLPNLVFSVSAVSFDSVRVGTTATQVVTLTNASNFSFSNNGLGLSGNFGFNQTNNCPTTLAGGQSCTINVSFSPSAQGPLVGTLNIFPAQVMSTPTVSLTGAGVASIAVLTQSLSFGPQVVGSTTSQVATLSNSGDAPLNIAAVVVSGDFTQSNNCGTSMAPGASCSIVVSFTPTTTGTRSGSLTVTDDSLSGAQQSTTLSGTGADYAVSASPASISAQTGHQARTTVAVSAQGGSFNSSVALSCGTLPSGVTCSFSPSSVVPGATTASSSLTINTQQSGGIKTSPGTYTVTVNGVSGSVVRSATITLTITK